MSKDQYHTKSTSRDSAIVEAVSLDENPGDTRKALRANIVNNKERIEDSLKITLIHQRKKRKDEWEDVESIPLNQLKGGEGVRLRLNTRQTKALYTVLRDLYEIHDLKGVPRGERIWINADPDRIIEVPEERKEFIEQLINKDYGEEIWEELLDKNPDLGTKLAKARIQQKREESLHIFEEMLENQSDYSEPDWQAFFENNEWIFGYGLRYQFLHLIQGQVNVGGTTRTGRGAQEGDFLMSTAADTRFTVLVEIKKPNTNLLRTDQSGQPTEYRNGAYLISKELSGGVAQVQSNCYTWETEGSRRERDERELSRENTFTVQPRGILVIGHTSQLDENTRSTFQLYRRNLDNPEIITFDELYERAKFIVNQSQIDDEQKDPETEHEDQIDDEGLPF